MTFPTIRTPDEPRGGLSLVELLVALVVLGIALIAFAFSQVGALNASTRSALVTEAKAAANRVLEEKTTEVLRVERLADTSTLCDQEDPGSGECNSFYFHDFYYQCPSPETPPSSARGGGSGSLRDPACSGDVAAVEVSDGDALSGVENVDISWEVGGRSGVTGEGILDIVVTATASTGAIVTVGTTITCYDIYPAPTKNAPEPCPETPANGSAGGRS